MSSLLTVETWNEYFLCCFLLNKKKIYIFYFSRNVSIFATDLTDNWNYIELLSCNSVRCRNTHSTHTSSALSVSLSLSLFFCLLSHLFIHTSFFILFFTSCVISSCRYSILFFSQTHTESRHWLRKYLRMIAKYNDKFRLFYESVCLIALWLEWNASSLFLRITLVAHSLTHSLTRVVRSIFLTRFFTLPNQEGESFFLFLTHPWVELSNDIYTNLQYDGINYESQFHGKFLISVQSR